MSPLFRFGAGVDDVILLFEAFGSPLLSNLIRVLGDLGDIKLRLNKDPSDVL